MPRRARSTTLRLTALALLVAGVATALALVASGRADATTTVALRIRGGHATDPRDHGRPVVLVAAALGVPTEVFRTAFSGVTPAGAGTEPDPTQVGRNKQALLKVLGPYGITNDQLDTASDRYRYDGPAGELWTHAAAQATATIRHGRVVAVRLVRAGAGYSSDPTVTVPGHPGTRVTAKVGFGKVLATNGSVASLKLRSSR